MASHLDEFTEPCPAPTGADRTGEDSTSDDAPRIEGAAETTAVLKADLSAGSGAFAGELSDESETGGSEAGADEAADRVAGPENDTEPDGEDAEPLSAFAKFRAATALAVGPLLTGYLVVAALLALLAGTASHTRFTTTGVLAAALPGWLAAYQVPIDIYGAELGILPLLPTIGLVVLTAHAAARAAARLDLRRPRQAAFVIGTVAAAHGLAGLVIAMLTIDARIAAAPLTALCYPAIVSGLAATAGVARRCGLLDALNRKADAVAVAGMRVGAFAVVLLLVARGALVAFGLLTSIPTAAALVPAGAGSAAGMILLSLGYLPNAVIAAVAFLAGSGFSIGRFAVSPLDFHGGSAPGVPLLAALPEHPAAWWPVLFLLPVVVGVLVGRRLRDADEDPGERLRAVAVATGVIAVCFALLAGAAGGRLGRGPFDPVSMPPLALSIGLALWIGVPAAFVAWFGGPRHALVDDEDETDEDPEADDDAELPSPREEEPAE